MKAKFIINPHSGRGKGKRAGQEIKQLLETHPELDWSWVETTRAGETMPLARQAAQEGCDLLVAVGGDGTVNEVLNVAVSEGKILGVIPAGTGNDLARTLQIPINTQDAFRRLLEGKPYAMDAGDVNGRFFLNAAGTGIDVQILWDVNKKRRFFKGSAAYVLAVLKNLFFFRPRRLILHIDDRRIETEGFLAVVANGKYFGGGMLINPQGSIEDGYFDVYVVRKMSKGSLLLAFPTIYRGTHIKNPNLDYYQARQVRLEAEGQPLGVQCDGEVIGQTPQEVVCLKQRIQIMR